jgi:hypothetical protein
VTSSRIAVSPADGRIAVILNRIEPTGLSDSEARSRGALPLVAVTGGPEPINSAPALDRAEWERVL